jgi:hypothetical protein
VKGIFIVVIVVVVVLDVVVSINVIGHLCFACHWYYAGNANDAKPLTPQANDAQPMTIER